MIAPLRRTHRHATIALAIVLAIIFTLALWFRPALPVQPFPNQIEESVHDERPIQSHLLEPAEARL